MALVLLFIAVPLVNFHPAVWGFVADALMEETLTGRVLALAVGFMLLTYVLGSACGALQSYLLEKAGQAFVRDIRVELFAKLLNQDLAYHDHSSSGELVTRITSDVDAMEQSVLRGLVALVEECVTFIVVAAMVLAISPVVGALSILPLAFSFIFIRIFNRRVKRAYDKARRQVGRIGSFVQGRLGGIQVVQGFNRETAEVDSFAERSDQFYEAAVSASRTRNRAPPAGASRP